jgi:PAS domain S-box-containing protein
VARRPDSPTCFDGSLAGDALDDAALAELVRTRADALVIADADGVITLWDPAAARLFGWGSDEANGQTLDLIIRHRRHGEDAVERGLEREPG